MKIKITIISTLLVLATKAQQPLKTDGNVLNSSHFAGSTNNQSFKIKTNNITRFIFGTNGENINSGTLKTDSLVITKGAHIFGQLHVGDSSLVSGTSPLFGGHDYQTSTLGRIIMGNADPYLGGPNPISAFRLGIGIQNPQFKTHINDQNNVSNFIGITNAATGFGATDGFGLGIITGGIAEVRQRENQDLRLFTNNIQRGVIQAGGRWGINTNTPGNRLTISSAAGDPYFGAASSGLRFTNMTSASPTILNPSNKVLSVDANGDVVLVPDGPGGGGGTTNVTAQNGLSNISPSIVEWGGTLLHDTYIDQAGYNIWWHNQGAFTHGASIPLSGTLNYKFGLLNQNFDKAMVINSSNVVSGTSSSQQLGLEIINNTPNLIAPGYTNKGIIVYNSGSYDNRNNFFSSVNGGVTPSPAPVVPGAFSYGVDAGAYNTDNSYGGSFAASTLDPNATLQYGIFAQADRGIDVRGVVGKVRYFGDGVAGSLSAGLWGETEANSTSNFGSFNYVAPNSGYQAGRLYFGTYSEVNTNGSTNSPTNVYGVFSRVFTPNNIVPGAQVYAVYGQATDINSYAGFFNGDVNVTGQLTAGVYGPSDQLLKTNINNITNAKGIISQLEPKSFFMDTTKYFLKGHTQKNYGLIAQQVQTVVPELVSTFNAPNKTDSLGNILQMGGIFKTLNYNAFIGILLANAKEQNARIDSLIAALGSSARAANPNNPQPTEVNNSNTSVNKHAVTLSKADMLVLDQNQPNPFNEKTIITYNVPEKYGYAQIIFTTTEGKIIKIADITQKGAGELTVYANDLSAGIYQYSLVVDGKTIETKKMIKQ
jgi:hypothetical protein